MAPDETTTRGGTSPARLAVAAAVTVVVVAVGAWVAAAAHGGSKAPAVVTSPMAGVPAALPGRIATLMALSPIQASTRAPGFSLVDQDGRPVSLSSLRGKAVVLEFMDPRCTDICPIVSKEFLVAYHDLGAASRRVAFVAINVNRYHASPAAMAAFSREHGLDAIPSWRFVTGPLPALRRAWHDYGITVEAPSRNADVLHTSVVYFIDPSGNERYLAMPQVDHTRAGVAYLPAPDVSAWGQGIALVAKSLAR